MGSAPQVRISVPTLQDVSDKYVGAVRTGIETGVNFYKRVGEGAQNSWNRSRGEETMQEKKDREEREGVAAINQAEMDARTASYNDAMNDKTLDSATRNELATMYQTGQSSGNIAATLAAARKGDGVYGIRKMNESQQILLTNMPGRKQTLSLQRNLGKKSPLGV